MATSFAAGLIVVGGASCGWHIPPRHLPVTAASYSVQFRSEGAQCLIRSSSSALTRQSPKQNYLMRRTSEPLLALSSVTELLWLFTTQTWTASNA